MGFALDGAIGVHAPFGLRIKDIDFDRRGITVREGERGMARVTMLRLAPIVPPREECAY